MTSPSPEQIEAEIDAQRAQLADTVDALAHKLDVKAQTRSRLSQVGPREIAAVAGLAVTLVALAWWRRNR